MARRRVHPAGRTWPWARGVLVAMALTAALTGCAVSPGPDATWSAPRSSVTMSPSVTSAPATPAPATPPPAVLRGRLVYIPAASDAPVRLVSWSPGGTQTPLLALPWSEAISSATVSPDGQRIAWIAGGTLTVAKLDGTGKKALGTVRSDCLEPSWTGDGTHVIAANVNGDNTVDLVDVATGAATPMADPVSGCHALFSADGSALAFADGQGSIMLAAGDGSYPHRIPALGGTEGGATRRRSFDPMSLSADGAQLALQVHTGDQPDGDAGRDLAANEIIDTDTGVTRPLSLGGTMIAAYFLPGDGVLVRVRGADGVHVALLSPDLTVVAEQAEPPALAGARLLAYVGAY